jgi:hypothetical protein
MLHLWKRLLARSAPRSITLRPQLEPLEERQVPSLAPVSSNNNTQTSLFALGLDKQVYEERFDVNSKQIGASMLTAPGQVQALTAITLHSSQPLLFVLGLDGQVYEQTFDLKGNPTSAYKLTAPGQVKAIQAVVDRSSSTPLLLAQGLDNQVWYQKFDLTGVTSSGYHLAAPGQVQSFIATGSTPFTSNVGAPVIFAIGMDSQVYEAQVSNLLNSVSPYFLVAPGQVRAIDYSGESNTFLAIGRDRQVIQLLFDTNGRSIGGYSVLVPGQVKDFTQTLAFTMTNTGGGFYAAEVFVLGLDGQVYEVKLDQSNHPTSGYLLTTPGQVKALRAWSLGSPGAMVFVIGLNKELYQQTFTAVGASTGGYHSTGTRRYSTD